MWGNLQKCTCNSKVCTEAACCLPGVLPARTCSTWAFHAALPAASAVSCATALCDTPEGFQTAPVVATQCQRQHGSASTACCMSFCGGLGHSSALARHVQSKFFQRDRCFCMPPWRALAGHCVQTLPGAQTRTKACFCPNTVSSSPGLLHGPRCAPGDRHHFCMRHYAWSARCMRVRGTATPGAAELGCSHLAVLKQARVTMLPLLSLLESKHCICFSKPAIWLRCIVRGLDCLHNKFYCSQHLISGET